MDYSLHWILLTRFANQGQRYGKNKIKKDRGQDQSKALPSASKRFHENLVAPPTDTVDSRRFAMTVNYRIASNYF